MGMVEKGNLFGMTALFPFDIEQHPDIQETILDKHNVSIANINSNKQIVIAGKTEDLQRAVTELKKTHIRRGVPLPVRSPFHSSYMDNASEEFKQLIPSDLDIDLTTKSTALYSNVTGDKLDHITPTYLANQKILYLYLRTSIKLRKIFVQ